MENETNPVGVPSKIIDVTPVPRGEDLDIPAIGQGPSLDGDDPRLEPMGSVSSGASVEYVVLPHSSPRSRFVWWSAIISICILFAVSIIATLRHNDQSSVQSGNFGIVNESLSDIPAPNDVVSSLNELQVNGKLQISHSAILKPTDPPLNPQEGQFYFDKSQQTMFVYDGKAFKALGASSTTISNTSSTTNIIGNTAAGVALQSSPTSTPQTGNMAITGVGTLGSLNTSAINSSSNLAVTTAGLSVQNQSNQSSFNVDTTSGTVSAGTTSVTHTTGGDAISLFDKGAISGASEDDPGSVEVGVRFKSTRAGYITGIRYYNPAGNNVAGGDIGQLWSCTDPQCVPASGGTSLAQVTFPADTTVGWKEARFSTPVAITANTYYVASYWSQQAFYYADGRYFAAPHINGPLYAPATGTIGNGFFKYNSQGFPDGAFNQTNYWVDPIFQPTDTYDTITSSRALTIASTGSSVNLGSNMATTNIQGASINILASGASTIGIGTSSSGAGSDLTLQAGSGYGAGTNSGGNLYLQGGMPGGSADAGHVIVKSLVNVSLAFQIQDSTGKPLFGADTSSKEIAVIGGSGAFASFALINSHFVTAQDTAPTLSVPTACGTIPVATITPTSTDTAGAFTITTGTGGTSATCDMTLTFTRPYFSTPKSIIVVGKSNAASVTRQIYVTTADINSFSTSFAVSAGGADSTTYSFNYWVVQ